MVMRVFRTALLAGAVIAVSGISGVAAARDLNTHVMTIQVPGGGVAEIRYTGDVPPQVVFSPVGRVHAVQRLFRARFSICNTRPDLGRDGSRSGEPDPTGGDAGECASLRAKSADRDGSG
jgi:hypothetical protein